MHKHTFSFLLFGILTCFVSCNEPATKETRYFQEIGDTNFDEDIDHLGFKFCDTSNILHKRAYVKYHGANTTLKNKIDFLFSKAPKSNTYNGYCIVRFAINCNDELGRIRLEFTNENANKLKTDPVFESMIRSKVKQLDGWIHPTYKGQELDGYSFFILKITNGKITLT